MTIRAFLSGAGIAAALTLSAGTAQAADPPMAQSYDSYWKWYAEVTVGGPLNDDYDNTVAGLGAGTYDPDSGFGVGGEIGAYFNENVRGGISLAYFTAGDGVSFGLPHVGDVNVYNVMANIYYEFNNLGIERFTPWIGAGLGFQVFDYDGLGAAPGANAMNGSDTAFAGALHAGFDYAVTDYVDIVGRYSAVFVGSHEDTLTSGALVSVDSHVEHVLMGGIRFKFSSMGM